MDELIQKHVQIATEISEKSSEITANLATKTVEPTSEGLSLLELKNHSAVDYLIDLTLVALLKASGEKLEGAPVVKRLVTARTVLEKIRPIEAKLKYQIEKSVKTAESGVLDADDPLRFKPDPKALMSQFDSDEEEDESNDDEEDKKTGLYRAPRNVPAFYDGDKTREEAETEEKTKEAKRRMSRSLIEDLKRQYADTPEEEFYAANDVKTKQRNEYRERVRFEEENFIRLPVTKKQKHRGKQRFSTVNSIGDEVTSFGTTNIFNDGAKTSGGKKRKASSFNKKSKKKFKR